MFFCHPHFPLRIIRASYAREDIPTLVPSPIPLPTTFFQVFFPFESRPMGDRVTIKSSFSKYHGIFNIIRTFWSFVVEES